MASNRVLVEAIYGFAADLMQEGVDSEVVKARLISDKGLDRKSASIVVGNLQKIRAKAIREAGQKNMLYGALWCVGGIVVTAVAYVAAKDGGTFVLAWGAIVFGGYQFIKGLLQSSR